MEEKNIEKYAKFLVDFTILKHDNKLLGIESLNSYIDRHLDNSLTTSDKINIQCKFINILTKEGYDIVFDTTKFDIIKYK